MNTDILSNLVITKITTATSMYTEKNATGKRVNRPCYALIIKYEGKTEYRCNGKIYLSDKNNPVILPKGLSYEWKCIESGHYYTVEFESAATIEDFFSFSVDDASELLNLFKSVEYRLTLRRSELDIECIRDVYSIILMLIRSTHKSYIPNSKQQKIMPAIKYMARNYNTDICNELLAKQTGLSLVYFRKIFTEIYGISPIAYLHRLRIEKAREMLESDHGSITEIAYSLGYKSIYDFSRAFKKYVGISPRKYKNSLQ